jgi:hypothetical protein
MGKKTVNWGKLLKGELARIILTMDAPPFENAVSSL